MNDTGDDAEDVALVAAMARGDREALGGLYRRHSGLLLGLAMRIVRERREAARVSRNAGDAGLEVEREHSSPEHARIRTSLAGLGPDQKSVLACSDCVKDAGERDEH